MTRLEDQLRQEREQKNKKGDSEALSDRILSERQDEAAKCDLTAAQRAENAKKEIEALRAEQELTSIQKGYKGFQDAVIRFETEQKAFEVVKTQYPEWQTKEITLNERGAEIEESRIQADKYSTAKRLEADNYFKSRTKEADLYHKTQLDKLNKETKDFRELIQRKVAELDSKEKIYNEVIEPACQLMIKDSNLIYKYLEDYIYVISEHGAVKFLGLLNSKLENVRGMAKLVHDSLYQDAVKMLILANKIKEGKE